MYGITGDQGVPMFEFLSPVQTGTTTFDPEDDNLMSDKNLDKIKDNFDGADPPLGSAQGQDLARAAQASAGIFGATVGSSLGNAYVGMRNQQLPVLPGNEFTGTDVVKAGVNSVVPFGKTSDVEQAGIDYTGGGQVYDRAFGDQAKAGLQTAAFTAGGAFVGRVIAGQDPMDAAKDAAKVGAAYYIGNAIAGPTGGKVVSWITNLFS